MSVPRLLLWCTVLATAFGVIEGAVVVYLRELYYPEGFAFPLKEMAPRILAIEIVREAPPRDCLLLGLLHVLQGKGAVPEARVRGPERVGAPGRLLVLRGEGLPEVFDRPPPSPG